MSRLTLTATSLVAVLAGALPAGAHAASPPRRSPAPPRSGAIRQPTWLTGVTLTEYYPTAETTCCSGAQVAVPGLPHMRMRVDFLYGAHGLSMQGEGYGTDGRMYHIAGLGRGGWVNIAGGATRPTAAGGWTNGAPYWRSGGYWLSHTHRVTFPLASGGWANGTGVSYVPPPAGISFASGASKPLTFWKSVAVDPHLIPLGSRIFVPAYVGVGGSNGWFVAKDTGGAIIARHIDIYRTPPIGSQSGPRSSRGQRVLVIPPPPSAHHARR